MSRNTEEKMEKNTQLTMPKDVLELAISPQATPLSAQLTTLGCGGVPEAA